MKKDKRVVQLIVVLSVLIPLVVAVLMLLPSPDTNRNYSFLPQFHAFLNGMTAIALVLGFYFIKKKEIEIHKRCMLAAFFLSSVFLISYVFYHFNTGHTLYGGQGIVRYVYLFHHC